MMGAYGILPYSTDFLRVMCNTNAFFAGGACLTLAKAALSGQEPVFDTQGDLDIWVPCFKPDSIAAQKYNKLAMDSFIREFEKCSLFMENKSAGADPIYSFGFYDEKNPKHSYQIWQVDTYVHSENGRKVQVIGIHLMADSVLPTPLQVVTGFDISICRCFVIPADVPCVHAPAAVFEEVKRGVFSLLPLEGLRDRDRTAERVAKYYSRGYVMEESVGCPTCNHSSVRALTEDEAIAYVAALMPRVTPVTARVTTPSPSPIPIPIPKNTVNVTEIAGAPVKPVSPYLVLLDDYNNITKKLFDDADALPNKFASYYRNLTPLLGEKVIHVNIEKEGRITTVRLYESILRRALSNIAPHNKGAGKHLMFWRGKTQFADYITDMAFDMVMEMSTKCE